MLDNPGTLDCPASVFMRDIWTGSRKNGSNIWQILVGYQVVLAGHGSIFDDVKVHDCKCAGCTTRSIMVRLLLIP